jgi:hypothetical protein
MSTDPQYVLKSEWLRLTHDFNESERHRAKNRETAVALQLRVAQLEAALRNLLARVDHQFMDQPPYPWDWKEQAEARKALGSDMETACEHDFKRYAINNAKSPADPPEYSFTPFKCIKCGTPAPTVNRGTKP